MIRDPQSPALADAVVAGVRALGFPVKRNDAAICLIRFDLLVHASIWAVKLLIIRVYETGAEDGGSFVGFSRAWVCRVYGSSSFSCLRSS